ncbi:MAG: extracellular solute-binding protein [Caldilineaceae bacterium]|nr:extracellular solute-binding protein [Caldilineaceae bacterium]
MTQSTVSRRRFLQLSGTVTTAAVLAACVAPSAPAGDSAGESGAGTSTTTLEIWSYPRTENDAEIIFAPMMETFAELHPEINPEIEVQPWGGRREKLYAAAAAGTAPDLWDATTDTTPAYIEKDVILGLNDFLTDEDMADYSASEIEAASFNGVIYHPLIEAEVNGPAYSGGLLAQLGYDPATAEFTTWDQLQTLGAQAAEKGWYLESLSTFNWGEFLVTVHEAGGQVYADDRSHSNLTEQPVIDALTRWVNEFNNNWVPIEYAIGSVDEQEGLPDYWLALEQVTARKEDAACVMDTAANPELQYVVGHARSITDAVAPVSGIVSGQGWAITKQTDAVDAAVTWLKYMTRPEQIGTYADLAGSTPVGTKSKENWHPDACTLEHVNRFGPLLFAGVDTNTLWQESKVVAGPYFQAAILGQATVAEALEKTKAEIDALLLEKYG